MINGGALEERRDSTAEKRVCACRMLGVQDAGPVVGLGAARKGFRSKHREHAILHAYSGSPFVVVLKKSMKSPLKGFYGHLSGSHSIF